MSTETSKAPDKAPDSTSWPRQWGWDVLWSLNRAAMAYWHRLLLESDETLAYLVDRGWPDPKALVKKYRLGYAPGRGDDAKGFVSTVLEDGFPGTEDRAQLERALLATGLARRHARSGRLQDMFYGRLIFPIPRDTDLDQMGSPEAEIAGFGGRITPVQEARSNSDHRVPKYLNTPETVLFHKGRLFYGWPWARAAFSRSRQLIVLEGYTDLIRVREAGIEHAVACLGTAVTDDHMAEVAREARSSSARRKAAAPPEIILATDADSAGRRAAERGARVVLSAGFIARIADFEGGKDPDDAIRHGGEEGVRDFLASIADAGTPVMNYLDVATDEPGGPGWDRSLCSLVRTFRDIHNLTAGASERQIASDARRAAARLETIEGLPITEQNLVDLMTRTEGSSPGGGHE